MQALLEAPAAAELTVAEEAPFRVLVTGSRYVTPAEERTVRAVLQRVCWPHIYAGRRVVIVHGDCPFGGVDKVADEWARATRGVDPEPHPADFAFGGAAAGPRRNALMAALGADIFLAFPGPASKGTWDCVRRAVARKIPGRIYPIGPPR